MYLTYGQINEALYQVYLAKFEPKNGMQTSVKYNSIDDVPMTEMLCLLRELSEKDYVKIED